MKFLYTVLLLFFSLAVNAQNIHQQRMNEIYSRIQNSLQKREKNQYLKNPHVFKITVFPQNRNPITGHIRLPDNQITCLPATGSQPTTIKAEDIQLIRITRWKKRKIKNHTRYTQYAFSPASLLAYTKNGKKYFIADNSRELFTRLYVFLEGNEIQRVYADFILYYDRKINVFYKTGKRFDYYDTQAAAGAWYQIKIESYEYDGRAVRRRERVERFAANPAEELPMQRSESQDYYENERKKRLEQQQREQAAEERRRAEEERIARQREEQNRQREAARNRRQNPQNRTAPR